MTGNENHTALVRVCRDYLVTCGAYVRKIHGGAYQTAGIADLVACLGGRWISIECKTGTARATLRQRLDEAEVIRAGGIWCEIRDIEQLEDVLVAAGLTTYRLHRRKETASCQISR